MHLSLSPSRFIIAAVFMVGAFAIPVQSAHAQTVSELQAIIRDLMAQIAALQGQQSDNSDNGEGSVISLNLDEGDMYIIEPGQDDAPAIKVEVVTDNSDVYVNTVTLAVKNETGRQKPWEAFDSISLWNGFVKLASVETGSKNLWKSKNGTYEVKVFTGNAKIPANSDIDLVAGLSVSSKAEEAKWQFEFSNKGTVLWTNARGSMSFNEATDDETDVVTIDISMSDEQQDLLEKINSGLYTQREILDLQEQLRDLNNSEGDPSQEHEQSNVSAALNKTTFTSSKPTISGSATGVTQVSLTLVENRDRGTVYASGPYFSVKKGKWSHKVWMELPNGSYTLTLRDANQTTLLTKTITIEASSVTTDSANATLNKTAFTTAKPRLSGTASGLSSIRFTIDNGSIVYDSELLKVKKGEWSHKVKTALENGSYTVTLYDAEDVELLSEKITIKKEVKSEDPSVPTLSLTGKNKTVTATAALEYEVGWLGFCTFETALGSIDWGDGKSETITRADCKSEVQNFTLKHKYKKYGTYTVTVTNADKQVSKTITLEPAEEVLGASSTEADATASVLRNILESFLKKLES